MYKIFNINAYIKELEDSRIYLNLQWQLSLTPVYETGVPKLLVLLICEKYSLSHVGPLKHRFFFLVVNTEVLHDPWLVESKDAEPQLWRNKAYRGPTITFTWIFNCVEGREPYLCMVQGSTVLFIHLRVPSTLQDQGTESCRIQDC